MDWYAINITIFILAGVVCEYLLVSAQPELKA